MLEKKLIVFRKEILDIICNLIPWMLSLLKKSSLELILGGISSREHVKIFFPDFALINLPWGLLYGPSSLS